MTDQMSCWIICLKNPNIHYVPDNATSLEQKVPSKIIQTQKESPNFKKIQQLKKKSNFKCCVIFVCYLTLGNNQ